MKKYWIIEHELKNKNPDLPIHHVSYYFHSLRQTEYDYTKYIPLPDYTAWITGNKEDAMKFKFKLSAFFYLIFHLKNNKDSYWKIVEYKS